MPLILGKSEQERFAFSETGGLGGPHPSTHQPNVKCVRNKQWKLIYNTTTAKKELYDLQQDKEENHNLIDRFPQVAQTLWQRLCRLEQEH